MSSSSPVTPFDFSVRTRVVFGPGAIARLGSLAAELGFRRTLVVADPGLIEAGHAPRATRLLKEAGIDVVSFHRFGENPDTAIIEEGRRCAVEHRIDSLVGMGGGSSLDCAKGISFLVTNGGNMRDYRGYGRATEALLPMIGIPTTTGTGSEAQSYALISDAETHEKMACGDPGAAFRIAILDPELTVSQPPRVTANTGFDAIAHAVETSVTTKRNPLSDTFSREAWRLLLAGFERSLADPEDLEARSSMQLGAHYAGLAIEASMLGATHACANPLTARYGTTHGEAIAVLLPHVVRWNADVVGHRYRDLLAVAGVSDPEMPPGEGLAALLERLRAKAGLPESLSASGVPRPTDREILSLAAQAAEQWTGRYNPRPLDASAAIEVYRCAL